MKRITLFVFFIFSILFSINAQQMFQNYSGQDIGNPKLKGSFSFNDKLQMFTLSGAGYNMWFERDEFFLVAQQTRGDFILSANLRFLGDGVDAHRKIGLIIRNNTDENSIYMDGAVHGDGLTSLQYREQTGGATLEKSTGIKAPDFVQLERKGNTFIFRISKDNQPLEEVGQVNLEMNQSVLAGMFISSHNTDVLEKAEFWNVRMEKPAAAGVNGYETPSPSRLEILDVETGFRKVLFETKDHIEAPNWSPDGKYLIYNSAGYLYKFSLKDSKISKINTGFANANNNDHGISFDGKQLAISHHAKENNNQSIIYTLPVTGGIPKKITEKGPSYWHGWSPGGNWLTYCARRDGDYNVFKIPVKGGKEIQLTTEKGLDDGPEYAPDGNFIYFNSTRTGRMQIWRMKPDGSAQEQLTFDNYQNWFAHPSPDGNMLIFISYLPEVPADSHPHNERVMLRVKPVDGEQIKTLAFLYGGQGTINVPSWSPDSKKVAFISYTY